MLSGKMLNLLQIQSKLAQGSTEAFAFGSALALALALPSALFATALWETLAHRWSKPKKIDT